ncbi:MAG: ACT domain-containing protein [Anaerolineales bacterium]|jgi:hypothetical protein
MAKDLTVIMEDRPGSLATLGEVLGRAGVNIEGVCAVTAQGKGEIHILVEDAVKAGGALRASGMQVLRETDVLVEDIRDRPGELGNVARRLAGAGVNIQVAYLATSTRLVVGVDNVEKARTALRPAK